MSDARVPNPDCCELASRNIAWFRRSSPAGAWHAASFCWDPRCDAPFTAPLSACPFCGAALGDVG